MAMVAHNWLWLSRGGHAARSPSTFRSVRVIPCARSVWSVASRSYRSARIEARYLDIETTARCDISRVGVPACRVVAPNCQTSTPSRAARAVRLLARLRRKAARAVWVCGCVCVCVCGVSRGPRGATTPPRRASIKPREI